MRRTLPIRLVAVAALATSASAALVLPAGTAFAKGPKPPAAICTGLSGNESTQTITGCSSNPDAGTGGTSVVSTNTTTWSTGKTSTETYAVKTYSGKKDKCPAEGAILSTLEIKEKGKVTGGTANLVGTKLKATVCLYSNGTVTQFPGTTLSF
jgi:hypothetical protein